MKTLERNLLPDLVIDIKKEVGVLEDSHEQSEHGCVENNNELELKLMLEVGDEQGDLVDEPIEKRAKNEYGKIKKRPCIIHDCEPVIIGQAVQHAKEKHRSYCKVCGQVFARFAQCINPRSSDCKAKCAVGRSAEITI